MPILPRRELAFALTPGETRVEVVRPDGALSASFAPAPLGREAARGTLVLIHGVASNASRWEEFTERTPLRRDWNVVRLDLRGHAASVTTVPATLEKHAEDLVALLDALEIRRAVWVGHSLGAQIAMMTATLYLERTAGLVLLDPLVDEALTPKAEKMAARRPLVRALEGWGRFLHAVGWRRRLPHYSLREHDQRAREMLKAGGDALEAFIKEYSSPWRDLGHIHLEHYMRDLLETGRPSPDIRGLGIPVLVFGSRSGSFTDPVRMARWVEGMPGGAYETVPCVHWPLTECPDEVSGAMAAWLGRTFPG